VAIHQIAAADPFLEQRCPPSDELPGPPFHLSHRRSRCRTDRIPAHLPDAGLPPAPERLRGALGGDSPVARRHGMPGCEHPRHLAHQAFHVGAGPHERRQPPGRRHPAHHHQVITDPAIWAVHRTDAQIHIGREPPVQRHLAAAGHSTRPGGGEVEEPKRDRLLQLVRPVTGEKDDGRMRL